MKVSRTKCSFTTTEYDRPISIEDLAECQLDGDDYDSGAMEAAAQTATNNSKAFGRLIELLMEKGLIDSQEIADLLGLDEVEIVAC